MVDESSQHAGHRGAVEMLREGFSRETHFRVEVVSDKFQGLNQVKRQRLVYQVCDHAVVHHHLRWPSGD